MPIGDPSSILSNSISLPARVVSELLSEFGTWSG